MIDLGPLHISWPLVFWMIAALHGTWSRRRTFLNDYAQLRYNRANGVNGALETFGVRAVAESARAVALYWFIALLGVVAAFIEPRPDPSTGGVILSWGLVALVWGLSFSDYVVRWVAQRLRKEPHPA